MSFRRVSERTYNVVELYEYAVGALGRRMRSVAEMKRLMRQKVRKQEDGEVLVNAVIEKLKEQKYLNDTEYATSYSTYRKDNEKFGRMRVITDLKIKGVHAEVIESTVGAAYEGVNEEELARAYLRRKRIDKKPADQKQAARVFRSLMRAGFPSRVIVHILKNWDVDEETVSSLESEAAEVAKGEDAPDMQGS
jgi:regulatory protein